MHCFGNLDQLLHVDSFAARLSSQPVQGMLHLLTLQREAVLRDQSPNVHHVECAQVKHLPIRKEDEVQVVRGTYKVRN